MKLNDLVSLKEMTLMLNHFPDITHTIKHLENNNEYIADLDSYYVFKSIYKNTTFYFLSADKEPKVLSFIQTTVKNNNHILLVAYTLPEHRKKSLVKRLLFFVKTKLGSSIIDYGALTQDGKTLYDELNKSERFKLQWLNIKTGEKVEYENKNDKISNIQQTDWRVLIEGSPNNTLEMFDRTLPSLNEDGNSWPIFFND